MIINKKFWIKKEIMNMTDGFSIQKSIYHKPIQGSINVSSIKKEPSLAT